MQQAFQGQRRLGGHRSEEHTSELQSLAYLVCRLLLEKKKQLFPLSDELNILTKHALAQRSRLCGASCVDRLHRGVGERRTRVGTCDVLAIRSVCGALH